MPVFHYKNSPLIDRVIVDTSHHGIARATIALTDTVTHEQVETLRQQLGARNLSSLMDTVDGRSAIQLRGGFKDADALLATLDTLGISRSGMTTEATAGDQKTPGFRDKVRGKALFLSALFYDLGNIAFIISGIQRGRHNKSGRLESHDYSEIGIGAAFSTGDLLMTFFGDDKGDEELQAATLGLKRHLHKKGIAVPQDDALNPDTLHQSGALKATDRWLRKHIIHIKCLSEFAGGLFTMHAGLKKDGHGHNNLSKVVAGLLISTGWLATFALDKPRGHHIFDDDATGDGIRDKMMQNPRGWIARPLAMGNNVANLWGSLNPGTGERARFRNEMLEAKGAFERHNTAENKANFLRAQSKQHDYIWNVFSACSFLIAHSLFGMSDTRRLIKTTDDDRTVMNDMVLLAANILMKQPETVRNASISEAADFVSGLAHVTMGKSEVEAAIREKMQGLDRSAWTARITSSPSHQASVSHAANIPSSPGI